MPAKPKINQHCVFETIDAKRYHSCVITGYSYDLIYFDKIVFPILHKKGIINIILLIDYAMLEDSLEKISANHFKHSQGYSISSIKQTGAFHPKIIQCFADNGGLLTIGSGNPTYGGYSGNWEAWVSFHVESSKDTKAYEFLKTWNYIKQLSSDIHGIVSQKLRWIEEYTTWLKDIKTTDNTAMKTLTEEYSFVILDNSNNGIYAEMMEYLPSKKAITLNIHSPFFDDDLSIIKSLSQSLSPQKINVFIQPKLTVLNHKELKNLKNKLDFYDIESCLGSFSQKTKKYVHAKLLEIVFEKQSYLLLGSANLSKSAMGTKGFRPRNAEISVLLQSQIRISFFENMGLKLLKDAKYSFEQIASLVDTVSHISDNLNSGHKQNVYNIDSIDRYDSHFTVYIHQVPKHQFSLKLFDFKGSEIANLKLHEQNKSDDYYELIFLKKKDTVDSVSGFLWDSKKISNTVIIQDVNAQTKSYPNPTYRKLKITLHSIENGEEHLWKLFNLIEPEKLIIKSSNQSQGYSHPKQARRHGKRDNGIKVLSHKEFQEKIRLSESRSESFLKHFQRDNALQVLSILNSVMGRTITEEDNEVIDDEEEVDIDKTNGRLKKSINIEKKKIVDKIHKSGNPESCRKYAERFFNKYLSLLDKLIHNDASTSDLQIFFAIQAIVTDLLIYYSTSPFYTSQKKHIDNLVPLVNKDTNKDFFWYGIQIVGKFYSEYLRKLLKSISSVSSSFFSQELLNESERIATLNSLFITCAVSVIKLKSAIRANTKNTINMCLCEFFNILDIAEIHFKPTTKKEATNHFDNIINKMRGVYELKGKNIFKVFNEFWNAYEIKSLPEKRSKVNDLDETRVFYSEAFGYTYLKPLSKENISENSEIRLALPGISWDNEHEDYLSEKIFMAKYIPLYHTQIVLDVISKKLHEFEVIKKLSTVV